jgi:hypothetical protein
MREQEQKIDYSWVIENQVTNGLGVHSSADIEGRTQDRLAVQLALGQMDASIRSSHRAGIEAGAAVRRRDFIRHYMKFEAPVGNLYTRRGFQEAVVFIEESPEIMRRYDNLANSQERETYERGKRDDRVLIDWSPVMDIDFRNLKKDIIPFTERLLLKKH